MQGIAEVAPEVVQERRLRAQRRPSEQHRRTGRLCRWHSAVRQRPPGCGTPCRRRSSGCRPRPVDWRTAIGEVRIGAVGVDVVAVDAGQRQRGPTGPAGMATTPRFVDSLDVAAGGPRAVDDHVELARVEVVGHVGVLRVERRAGSLEILQVLASNRRRHPDRRCTCRCRPSACRRRRPTSRSCGRCSCRRAGRAWRRPGLRS